MEKSVEFKNHEKTAKEYKIGQGGFWRPEPGENKIRVLTAYEAYGSHWVNEGKKLICDVIEKKFIEKGMMMK